MKQSPTIKDAAGKILDSFPNDFSTRRMFDGSDWYYATTSAEALLSDAAFLSAITTYKASLSPTTTYKLGAYYFPGWIDGIAASRPLPWELIDPYEDRIPMQGRYQDGQQYVAENQLRQMAYTGIDFVAIDWYWNGANFLDQAVTAYKEAIPAISSPIKYCLMWDNGLSSGSYPTTTTDWLNIYTEWINNHFKNGGVARDEFYTIDGKPVVILFSPDHIRTRANALYPAYAASETATLQMLNAANAAAISAGLAGIYFIGCMRAQTFWVGAGKYMETNGYSAITNYLTHYELTDRGTTAGPLAHSFAELDGIYQREWSWIVANSTIPYIVPIAAGWDRSPWGGSGVSPYNDPLHDNCTPSTTEFATHMTRAKTLIDANSAKTLNTAIFYAWNELGEGGYIEPTTGRRLTFNDEIKTVFVK